VNANNPLPKKIESAGWLLLALMSLLSLPFHSFGLTMGIILGGMISVLNFHMLSKNLMNVFLQDKNHIRLSVIPRYVLRLAATGVVLYLIISTQIASVIGLVIGLSVIVIEILTAAVVSLFNKNFLEEL